MNHRTYNVRVTKFLLIALCLLPVACSTEASGLANSTSVNSEAADACTATPAPGSVEEIARRFLDATLAQDKPAAIACLRKEEQKEEDGVTINLNDEGLMKSYELGTAVENGDKAHIPVTVTFNNDKPDQNVDLQLVREDGEWRVDFMATLMKMMEPKDPE